MKAFQERSIFKMRFNLIEKFITSLGVGLAISNVIDRHFKGIESYVTTDIMIVLCVLLVSFYDFKRLSKLSNTHNGNDTKWKIRPCNIRHTIY